MNESTLEMSDGFSVYTAIWLPEREPIGHIHLLHGMSEHINRYVEFAEFLVGKGYIVSGHDHRGHGKTAELNGKQGFFAESNGFDRVVQDAHEIITTMRKENPSPQFILFGHSMGSFIGRRYIQLFGVEVDKAIFSGTGGDPGIMRYAAQALAYMNGKVKGVDKTDYFLNKLVFGGFNKGIIEPVTPFDWLSREGAVAEKYINDPMCGFVPTTQFFSDLFTGLGEINAKAAINKIPKDLPIYLFSGSDDPVGDYGKGVLSVAKQFDDAGIQNVTFMLYEGGRHEMLKEKNRHHVFESVTDWIEKK